MRGSRKPGQREARDEVKNLRTVREKDDELSLIQVLEFTLALTHHKRHL